MNAPFKQTDRLGRLTTSLGPDALALLRFDGTDHLNDLFEYHVEALSTRDDLDFDSLVGTHASVEIEAHSVMRPFDGIVTRARWKGVGENGHVYELTLRPWFWLAGRRRNQRIFHNKNVVQILQELLSDYSDAGQTAFEMQLSESYPTLEYTVQYRESDLDFARRQMERHGISFHFRHELGSHTLVMTDNVINHKNIGPRPFKRYDGHHSGQEEHFWDWAPERNLTTGKIRLIDYNFKMPTAMMETEHLGDAAYAFGQLESYEYPGDYDNEESGRALARLRTRQERGADHRIRAQGDCVSLGSGMVVTLTGQPVPGGGDNFVCLSASHSFVSEAYGSGGANSDGYAFTGSYTLMPESAPMAPPRRTPQPMVQGPQTAVVVGAGEIDCDEYGRILVQFHWDLSGARSMRCRVAQNWAGNGLGGVVIPRVGMEVVADFIDGDPDKPIVTGCVVNGQNGNIYGLPASKTKSGFKTKTHEGSGFNELSFEDANGAEKIFMHAQKDKESIIQDNESTTVVSGDRSIAVNTGDETKSIGSGNLTETVALARSMTANTINETAVAGKGGPGNITYRADDNIRMTASKEIELNATHDIKESTKKSHRLQATHHVESHADLTTKLTAGQKITLSVGKSTSIVITDGKIVLTAGSTSVTLSEGTLDQIAGEIHLNTNK